MQRTNQLTTDTTTAIPLEICPDENPTDKPRRVYICEDSPEGILTAIYDAWADRYGHTHNYIQIDKNLSCNMFYEYINVSTDVKKAASIVSSIRTKISSEFYYLVESCLLSGDPDRADDIYRLIILGYSVGSSARSYLTYPPIQRIIKLERNVWNETHHYMGFIRFEELKGGTLFARFRPKNNVISKLIPHFADRFPEENLIIADVRRNIMALSNHGKIGFVTNPDINFDKLALQTSDNEQLLIDLWKCFVDTIEIKERSNTSLQRQNMPLRFREFTTEFI